MLYWKQARRILKETTGMDVSKDAIDVFTSFIEDEIKRIADEIIIAHNERNELAQFHKMPEKKRIHSTAVRRAINSIKGNDDGNLAIKPGAWKKEKVKQITDRGETMDIEKQNSKISVCEKNFLDEEDCSW